MPRIILIDNHTGYIWGDSADLECKIFVPTGMPTFGSEMVRNAALEYAAALDAHIGGDARDYEECSRHSLASNETGYHAYRADVNGSDAVALVTDGQDQETIDAVLRDCEYITSIRVTTRER